MEKTEVSGSGSGTFAWIRFPRLDPVCPERLDPKPWIECKEIYRKKVMVLKNSSPYTYCLGMTSNLSCVFFSRLCLAPTPDLYPIGREYPTI